MYEEEDEVSLLDILVVVAENLKVLLLGPLAIGLLALAISYAQPHSFLSTSILSPPASPQTPAQAIAVMVSPLVLDRVIESLKLSEGRSLQIARAGLAKQIMAAVGKDGLLRLDVTANTPVAAQAIANAVIDSWLVTTVPQARERAELEARLAYAKVALAAVRTLMDRLMSESTANLNKPLTRGEAGISMVALGELQARYFSEVLTIPRTLQGLARDVIVQPPTLPTEPATKRGLTALLAAFAAGFSLLLWVFARQAWRRAAQDSKSAEKQARLRRSLGFNS
ncbi:MAG: hypothetical protein H7293_12900 [Candidatus Saccharibacteria bacterium]|nr:hypothetical protein [Rhodoferax sp.]